jgi:hypothetical protein
VTDIATLFATDPHNLSDRDLDELISQFRQKRQQFQMGNKKAGSTKAPTPKQAAAKEILGGLKLKLDL